MLVKCWYIFDTCGGHRGFSRGFAIFSRPWHPLNRPHCCTSSLCYACPADIFERRRKYGVPVWMSRHPELNGYIHEV